MRFSVQNIADWILDKLFDEKRIADNDLFWRACNEFLRRNEIQSGNPALDKFSKNYNRAIQGLKRENYIFHNEMDNVIVFSQIERKYIRPLQVEAKRIESVKCLYIAEFDNGCKIGMTKNLKSRVNEYLKPWSRVLLGVKVLQCDNPAEVEKHLKVCFRSHRMGNSTEFFNLPLKKIELEAEAFLPLNFFENYDIDK